MAKALYIAAQQKKLEQEEQQRLEAQEKMLEKNQEDNNEDNDEFCIWPKYTYNEYYDMDIERKEDKPDTSIFMEIGFDKEFPQTPEARVRHYRKFYTKPLEDVPEVMGAETTFVHEHIFKAKIANQGLFGGQATPKDSVAVQTGVFKGYIQVFNQQRKDQRMAIIENLF